MLKAIQAAGGIAGFLIAYATNETGNHFLPFVVGGICAVATGGFIMVWQHHFSRRGH